MFQILQTLLVLLQVTTSWISTFYLYCPNTTAAYTPDSFLASTTVSSPTGACGYALGGDTCQLQCAAGYSPVAGSSSAMTCMRGTWTGRPLVCGATCPALNAPITAASCTRYLQVCTLTSCAPASPCVIRSCAVGAVCVRNSCSGRADQRALAPHPNRADDSLSFGYLAADS